MKSRTCFQIFSICCLIIVSGTVGQAQQIYPRDSDDYRYTSLASPAFSCYDSEYCVCWHKMDVRFYNSGSDAYDVRGYMTCRPCSMNDDWPEKIYEVNFGDIQAGQAVWSDGYFALEADACDNECPAWSDNPCWRIEYRDSPTGNIRRIYNVPWKQEWLCECGPTLISLTEFTAKAGNASVQLSWTTESEVDNAGFNIYRSDSEAGEYVQINESLIPANGSPTDGAAYNMIDTGVKNRKTYYYQLEDIDFNGTATMQDVIVSATPRLIKALLK